MSSTCPFCFVCGKIKSVGVFQLTDGCQSAHPQKQWWLRLRPLLRILGKHDSAYEEEGMYITVAEECLPNTDTLLGIVSRQYHFSPLVDLIAETNFGQRIPRSSGGCACVLCCWS
ncbi:hypothetical protein KR059_010614 [Drosophila kikkawai]|nr:hypothetical protein KR059_010614 [Drosophila kikkawai]